MWAMTSLWPQKVVCGSQIYSARAKLKLISDQARDLVKNCFEGRPLCVPFKTAVLHPGSRVIEREQFDDISPVLSVETLCLVGCG